MGIYPVDNNRLYLQDVDGRQPLLLSGHTFNDVTRYLSSRLNESSTLQIFKLKRSLILVTLLALELILLSSNRFFSFQQF